MFVRAFPVVLFAAAAAVSAFAQGVPATRQLFGMHAHRLGQGTVVPDRVGSWRFWDAGVTWAAIETSDGLFDFKRLDFLVAEAERRGQKVLLPLGMTPRSHSRRPDEPCPYGAGQAAPPVQLEPWIRFVQAVARRYAGRVEAYEIWNEPDSREFFSGTPAELVELQRAATKEIRRLDPRAKIVSSGPSSVNARNMDWLDRYATAGGLADVDVVGVHFYAPTASPEILVEQVSTVRTVLQKHAIRRPIWNTETGWRLQQDDPARERLAPRGWTALTHAQAAAFVFRAYVLAASVGIERYYWYSWDHLVMGLLRADGSLNEAGATYQELAAFLPGWTIRSCSAESGMWSCHMTGLARGAVARWSEKNSPVRVDRTTLLWKPPFVQCQPVGSGLECDGPVVTSEL